MSHFSLIYLSLTAIIILCGIAFSRSRTLLLALTVFILALIVNSLYSENSEPWQSLLFSLVAIGLAISAASIKHAALVIYQVASMVKTAQKPYFLWWAAPLWLPIAIAVSVSFTLASWRDESIKNEIYEIRSNRSLACRSDDFFVCNSAPGLRDNLQATVKNAELKSLKLLKAAIDKVKLEADSSTKASLSNVRQKLFDSKGGLVPREPFSKPKKCKTYEWLWPFNIGKCVKSEIMFMVWSAYNEFYIDLVRLYDDWARKVEKNGSAATGSIREQVHAEGELLLAKASINIGKSIDWIFFTLAAATAMSTVWVLIIAFKLLAFIVCRILFDKKFSNAHFAPLHGEATGSRIVACEITRKFNGGRLGFDVPPSATSVISMTRVNGVSCLNPGQPILHSFALFWRRILTQQILLDRFAANDTVRYRADKDCKFVRIDLKEGEALLFNFSSLVAFTEDVSLSTSWRFDVSGILRERYIQPLARGPGSLYLCGRGGSVEVLPNSQTPFANMQDIIAIDAQASFQIEGKIDLRSIYLRSFAMRPDRHSLVIQQAPLGSYNQRTGLWSRALFFVSPI